MNKLQILIRYTDILTFFDIENEKDSCRASLKPRARNISPIELIGTTDEVISRALAVVGLHLPDEFRQAFERDMAIFRFPSFDEYLTLFENSSEALTASAWRIRYERSQRSFLEFGNEPPTDRLVMPFDPLAYHGYRSYTISETPSFGGAANGERFFMQPKSSSDPDIGWFIQKKEWWRFFYILR